MIAGENSGPNPWTPSCKRPVTWWREGLWSSTSLQRTQTRCAPGKAQALPPLHALLHDAVHQGPSSPLFSARCGPREIPHLTWIPFHLCVLQWGQDRRDGKNLSHLLQALGEIEGLRWIRLLYCYPSYFGDDLIEEIATNPKVRTGAAKPCFSLTPCTSPLKPTVICETMCQLPKPCTCIMVLYRFTVGPCCRFLNHFSPPFHLSPHLQVCKYIDMPLQHIANMTLLGMNRPPQAHTLTLLHKLRDRIPGLGLRTTFIAGFPGESEAEHRELVNFVRDFKFDRMGCFAYSEEDGTPAAELQEQVPPEQRDARRDELIQLQQRIGEAKAQALVGAELDVLVDGHTEDGELYGRTQWDAPDVDNIVFMGQPAEGSGVAPPEVGQMRRCRVVGSSIFDLEAVPID